LSWNFQLAGNPTGRHQLAFENITHASVLEGEDVSWP
jgi:hypothetical protein